MDKFPDLLCLLYLIFTFMCTNCQVYHCGWKFIGEKDLDRKFYLPDDSVTYIGGEEKSLTLREIIRRLEVSTKNPQTRDVYK